MDFPGGGRFEGKEPKRQWDGPRHGGAQVWTGEQAVRLQGAGLDLGDFMGRVRVYFILKL